MLLSWRLKVFRVLLFFAAVTAFAQTNAQTVFVTTAPSGSCQTRANLRYVVPGGTIYTCQSGTWGQVTAGGGTVTLSGVVTGPSGSNTFGTAGTLPNGTVGTTQTAGDASTNISTDAFVASAIAYFTPYGSVQAGTIAVLSNTPVYNNGTSGVGATLTAGSNGALAVDGYVVLLNDRILVKNQASALQNGVYTETTLGDSGTKYVLTRATDYNSLSDINFTGDILLLNGSQVGQSWYLNAKITAVGTSALNYSQDTSSTNSGNGNVKATGNLANGDVIIGNGGKTIQDSGTLLTALAPKASPTFTGTVNSSGATHTFPAIVVASTGALPVTGCSPGEQAYVTGATLGQQNYQNSGTGACVWTQQLNSGTATGGGISVYSGTALTVTANTYYFPVGGGGIPSTTETNVDLDSSSAATIANFYVQQSVAIGAGNTAVYTWRKNGVSQSSTCTISGASATSCSDTVHSFNVSQGDLLTIQLVTTGTIIVTPNIGMMVQFGNITATGTVNTGTTGQVAYYAGNGAAVSGGNLATTCTAPQFLSAVAVTGGTCLTPVLTRNSISGAYTTVLGDAGKMLAHLAADNNARTITIDSNANVAYPIGTCLNFVNMINTITIAITSDTMTLMGANITGSRTLAVGNWATACKVDTTVWVIGGSSGLT